MRLTTWNCFRGKTPDHCLELLEPLRADLITLQECSRPDGDDTSVIWRGTDPAYGTAVVSTQAAVQLKSISIPSLDPLVVPVRVHAPRPFVFVGVCTHRPYNAVAWEAMSACVAASEGLPVVAAGDFNSSPGVSGQARASAQFLERMRNELGLVSVYHHFFGEKHGVETRATFYHHWKESKPFHIDYCFIPEGWVDRLAGVEVGTFAAWRQSDHRPLTVDLKGEPDARVVGAHQSDALVQRDARLADVVGREAARLRGQVLAVAADGDEEDAVLIQAGQQGVGGEVAVECEEADRGAIAAEEVQELEDGVGGRLAADVGVGAQEQAGVGILGEGGGEADKSAIASAGPVLLQGFVVAPVERGGEVEVGGVGYEAAPGPDAGQGAEQALFHGARDAVGIGAQPGGPGQHVEAGEEPGAAVHAPQVVGGMAADARALEGDEGQRGLQRGQGGRAGIVGGVDGVVDSEVADQGQQAEDAGGGLALEALAVAEV